MPRTGTASGLGGGQDVIVPCAVAHSFPRRPARQTRRQRVTGCERPAWMQLERAIKHSPDGGAQVIDLNSLVITGTRRATAPA